MFISAAATEWPLWIMPPWVDFLAEDKNYVILRGHSPSPCGAMPAPRNKWAPFACHLPQPDYLAAIERHMQENPSTVVVTGNVLADGINGPGLSVTEGKAILARDSRLDCRGAPASAPLTARVLAELSAQDPRRLLVHRSILDTVRTRLAKRLEALKVGPATDPASDMGPMINVENVKRVDGLVEEAIAQGAKVVVRGGPAREGRLSKGAFYQPTLLEINDASLAIAQNEVFGPVLVMQAFDSESEAVALANDSMYGLAASVWSTDVDRPFRIARQIDAGTVWINNWAVIYDESEEGGYKQSGIGRLNGASAIDDFVQYRTIIHEVAL